MRGEKKKKEKKAKKKKMVLALDVVNRVQESQDAVKKSPPDVVKRRSQVELFLFVLITALSHQNNLQCILVSTKVYCVRAVYVFCTCFVLTSVHRASEDAPWRGGSAWVEPVQLHCVPHQTKKKKKKRSKIRALLAFQIDKYYIVFLFLF
jgi:hypothetical protein